MPDPVILTGQRVLVLEDDYYLASDAANAVREAGGTVVGPFANERSALEEIASMRPTAALLDVNLGNGPSYEAARVLARRGVPFIFMTGYDDEVIPKEFAAIARLRKPVESMQMVSCLGSVLRHSPSP